MNEVDSTIPFVSKDKDVWIEHYAKCALKRIEEPTICQYSWQDDMIKIMKTKIIEDYIRNTSEQQFQIDKKYVSWKYKYLSEMVLHNSLTLSAIK